MLWKKTTLKKGIEYAVEKAVNEAKINSLYNKS